MDVGPTVPFAFSPDPDSPKTKVVTIEDYDIGQVKQLCMKVVMGCLIGAFIHYKWNVTAPLFMQCFLLPMQVNSNHLHAQIL